MKDPQFAKLVVFINSLLPLALMVLDGAQGQLGPNVGESVVHTTGFLAILFLILSLSVTPLRRITGSNYFSHFRRMLGLFAFFYGCVHLACYFALLRGWNIGRVIEDVIKRPFIFLGMLALLLMVPLAITSTNGMIKKLGAANWKRLHKLAYVAAVSGIIHYWMATKLLSSTQWIFAVILAILLIFRILPKRPVTRATVPATTHA